MHILKVAVATVACVLFLTACGQKGPLYFPEPSSSTFSNVDK